MNGKKDRMIAEIKENGERATDKHTVGAGTVYVVHANPLSSTTVCAKQKNWCVCVHCLL